MINAATHSGRARRNQPKTTMKAETLKSLKVGALLMIGGAAALNAQPYAIDWHTIDAGGGTSTGGGYSVSGTIGQHDAGGPMTGGNFSLTGGLWALSAVQVPAAPRLRIFLSAPNAVVVAWPAPSKGWTLQVNANLSTTNWTTAAGTINVAGGENQFLISPAIGSRFYRLSYL